jgi:hypothetical protein
MESHVEEPAPAGWDWGRDVRPGMLFTIDGSWVRVRGRRGAVGRQRPDLPDADDLLQLCRAVGAGRVVRLVVSDPATAGCLHDRRHRQRAVSVG